MLICIIIGSGIIVEGTKDSNNINAAFDSVITFKGIEDVTIKLTGYEKTPYGNFLVLSNNAEEFWVNEDNLEVERYSSYFNYSNSNIIKLTNEEAYEIAQKFVQKDISTNGNKQYQLIINKLNDGGDVCEYEYQWRDYTNNIEGPSLIDICINPSDGNIMSYVGINRDIIIPIDYSIASQNAESLAIQQFDSIEVQKISSYLKIGYDEEGYQKLFWVITVHCKPENYQMQGGIVHIDAKSGEILRIYRWK